MSAVDLDSVFAPISPDDPCGADVEYHPAFAEIERTAQGKPEQQIGSTIVAAEEPDWKLLQKQAIDLLARSKDLRVAAHLAKALLRTAGWSGFAQGLALLRGLVERYWDGVYPRLDPSDDNDPTMRVNVLTSIADPAVLSALRSTPLIVSRALGRFSLKDIEVASGDAPAPAGGGEPPTLATIEAAVREGDPAALDETMRAIRASREALAGLEEVVSARVDSASSPNFGKLPAMVRKAESFLAAKLAQRAPDAGGPGGDAGDGQAPGSSGHGSAVGGRPFAGAITSRDDVVRALEAIVAYYAKNEPSSPIPLFMERCKRMVMMNFVDIVRELVPDAVPKVDELRGQVGQG
jgi:type VI secretion system protein ImpA